MKQLDLLSRIKELYANGENIIEYLRTIEKRDSNTIEDILISYDLQAGSYVQAYIDNKTFKEEYCKHLAKIIDGLGSHSSILEVGVGEATTLGVLLKQLKVMPKQIFGFDISWSRLKFARNFLHTLHKENDIMLFTADMFEIPLPDNSIDIVYTSHSIEPNGGREEEALKELYRITRKYLVLLEPAYDFADETSRLRMERHKYVIDLYNTILKLGYNVLDHRLFDLSANPLNPTGLTIIGKDIQENAKDATLVCPVSKTRLIKESDSVLFAPDSMLAYPILKGIPCLLRQNAIIAAHFLSTQTAAH